MLLNSGADPNAKWLDGWTPLHVAASGGHADIVRLLLEHGADVHALSNIYGEPPGTPPHVSALLLAPQQPDIEVLELLLDADSPEAANFQESASSGLSFTPLMHAARFAHLDMVKLLLDKGADTSKTNSLRNNYRALEFAIQSGNPDVVKLLIKKTSMSATCRTCLLAVPVSSMQTSCSDCVFNDEKIGLI